MTKIDLAALRAKHEQLIAAQGGGNTNKDFLENFLTVNTNEETVVRVLPSIDEEVSSFFAETAIHRIPKDYNNKKGGVTNYHCARLKGDACPICDVYYDLWKTGVKTDEDLARKVKPGKRYYLNVYDRANKGVKIFSTGIKVFDKIISSILNTEDYGDFLDTVEGHDFKIVKTQQGTDWPDYSQSMARPKATKLGTSKEISEIMDNLHDIHGLIKVKPYDELKKVGMEIRMHSTLEVQPSEHKNSEPEEEASDEDFANRLKG